jgi:hypothetical protein
MHSVELFYERVKNVERGLACIVVIEVPVSIHSTVLLLIGFVIFLYSLRGGLWKRCVVQSGQYFLLGIHLSL